MLWIPCRWCRLLIIASIGECSKGGGCLLFCFLEPACCPRPISPGCVLSSQWSPHASPRVDAFQIIMQPLEHYSRVCGSFFSGSSHVSFFLSGSLCVIPPMCDNAWRFLPSSTLVPRILLEKFRCSSCKTE